MQNVLLRLREVQPSLSSTERQIAQFILDNPDETTTLTIRELARRWRRSAERATFSPQPTV